MFFNKLKILIYILMFTLVLNFILPVFSYALDKDSIYVWSNSTSSITTSNTTDQDDLKNSETNIENARKFFGYNFW